MSYILPVEQPVPVEVFDLCHGPFILAAAQEAPYSDRWAVWVASAGLRFGKFTEGMVMGDAEGQADDLFGAVRPTKVAICFEQDSLPVIAIQKDATTIEIRRKVSNVVTAYLFAGLSPILFYNGQLLLDSSTSDAVCLYLKAAGTKIYCRFQRENFGVEYVLNPTLAVGVTIASLRKTDKAFIGGISYQTLHAVATDGRQLFFRTSPYPPPAQTAEDKLSLSTGLDSGAYLMVVTTHSAPHDAMVSDTGFDSGIYLETVQPVSAPTDKMTMDSAFDSGIYLLTVIVANAPTDKLTMDTGLASGVYTLIVIVSTAPTDKMTMDTGFDSGIYA